MTRKEAEHDAKELNKTEPKWFCPLINSKCRKDCINFTLAYVISESENKRGMLHDANDDSFMVEGFFCSNAQFISPFACGGH